MSRAASLAWRLSADCAQYDTPLNLFDRPDSVFRNLCDVKQISRQDLLNIQAPARMA
jgi:hypothetical protein